LKIKYVALGKNLLERRNGPEIQSSQLLNYLKMSAFFKGMMVAVSMNLVVYEISFNKAVIKKEKYHYGIKIPLKVI
jgi:hypothetical protein